MLKNLKITKKFIVLISILGTLFLAVSSIALLMMKNINSIGNILATKAMPAVVWAQEIKANLSDYRITEMMHIIAQTPDEIQQIEVNLQAKEKDIMNSVESYNQVISSKEDREIYDKLLYQLNRYQLVHKQVAALSRENRTDEVMLLVKGESSSAYRDTISLIDQIVKKSTNAAYDMGTTADRLYLSSVVWIILGIIITIVIGSVVSVVIITSIKKPVDEIETAMNRLSQGYLDASVQYTAKDELGHLANSIRTMLKQLSEIIYDLSHIINALAQGDFTVKSSCEEVYQGDFKPLLMNLRKMRITLSETMYQINESAEQVSLGTEQVSQGTQAYSQGATQQASSVEELANLVGEISKQISQNAESAEESSKQASEVGNSIMLSNEKMKQMVESMEEISKSSNEIGKIIKTIEDIAFQTNILALNAAVEAARAGVAGKGFAVVADEVRNLASKSAEASKSTARLIETSIRAVERGSGLAYDAAETLMETVEYAKKVIASIEQISEASTTQAESVTQITQGIDEISGVIQTNTATAQESAAASEEMASQAQLLKNLIEVFRLDESAHESNHGNTFAGRKEKEVPNVSDDILMQDKY